MDPAVHVGVALVPNMYFGNLEAWDEYTKHFLEGGRYEWFCKKYLHCYCNHCLFQLIQVMFAMTLLLIPDMILHGQRGRSKYFGGVRSHQYLMPIHQGWKHYKLPQEETS